MRLASTIIARFCQMVNETLNQDKISPSSAASKNREATARTTTPRVRPIAVEVFINSINF